MDTTKIRLSWTCRARTHARDLGITSRTWPDTLPVTGPGGIPLTVFLVQKPDYAKLKPAIYASGTGERPYKLTVRID